MSLEGGSEDQKKEEVQHETTDYGLVHYDSAAALALENGQFARVPVEEGELVVHGHSGAGELYRLMGDGEADSFAIPLFCSSLNLGHSLSSRSRLRSAILQYNSKLCNPMTEPITNAQNSSVRL